MLNSGRRAGLAGVSAAGRLAAVSVGAGLLVAAVVVPVVGLTGVIARNAANTFNTLKVPSLGQIPSRSEILTANGKLIAYYYPNNLYRVPVSFNQIAPVMRNAIVAIEDSRFYLHGAFDFRGTIRALANNLGGHSTQGGSTLAQQYVKNALILTATTKQEQAAAVADTTARKLRELRMAAAVEHEMTKNQLLAAYLNAAFFDNNAYGIQVAAERYFSTSALNLNLRQSALLAGVVENPAAYDPFANPSAALARRKVVLERMADLGYITRAQAHATETLSLGLRPSTLPLDQGCTAGSAANEAFFCDYAMAVMRSDPAYAKAYAALNTSGDLRIYTTLDPQDQRAAQNAVDWVLPPNSGAYNPGGNVDTEVLIQPATGKVRAIAVDRPYGTHPSLGQTTVDYAVQTQYDGGTGVQTGSSSKLFTLLTALKQNVPFGFSQAIVSPSTLGPYFNCQGQPTSVFNVTNSEGAGKGIFTLYNGTTQSINVFYAHLEQKVGLCEVVRTAASLGMTYANGGSLLRPDKALGQDVSADNIPSFTLGAVPVAPMSMAAAYATVAARGIYCSPIAIGRILTGSGASLPVKSANCHRVLSTDVADAANYILQGVLASPGTAAGRGLAVQAAGKTGTSDHGYYAAFGGYTPRLAGYVSVFNPVDPITGGAMVNGFPHTCYRENPASGGGQNCPGQMFGDNAPAATWQMTFMNADLGNPPAFFVAVPQSSPFFSMGDGVNSPKPPKPPKGGGHGGHGGHGGAGGPPPPLP
ncbi:MAG TPA: transglycosylase domain-containing protein [Streptosporangiaceae bacterium]|nr:transglycosylase domain-containing protein [Streptosporangiaceae bacterium]